MSDIVQPYFGLARGQLNHAATRPHEQRETVQKLQHAQSSPLEEHTKSGHLAVTGEEDSQGDSKIQSQLEEAHAEKVELRKRLQRYAHDNKKFKQEITGLRAIITSHEIQNQECQAVVKCNLEKEISQSEKRLQETTKKLYEVSKNRLEVEKEYEGHLRQAFELHEAVERDCAIQNQQDKYRIQELQGNLNSLHHLVQEQKDASATQISELRGQIEALKHTVAASARHRDQICDDLLREKLNNWALDAQNWVLQCCKRASLIPDATNLSRETKQILALALPVRDLSNQVLNKHVVCKSVVFSEVFPVFDLVIPVAGQSEHLTRLAHFFEFRTQVKNGAGKTNLPEFSKWNRLTFAMINKLDEHDKETLFGKAVDEVSGHLDLCIMELLSLGNDAQRRAGPRSLVQSAIEIACLVKAQRAQYEFHNAQTELQNSLLYHTRWAEDEFGQKSPENENKPVAAVFSPLLLKYGDGKGERMHLKNVICKAKVLCSKGRIASSCFGSKSRENVASESENDLLA